MKGQEIVDRTKFQAVQCFQMIEKRGQSELEGEVFGSEGAKMLGSSAGYLIPVDT